MLFPLPLATTILQYFFFCDLEDKVKKEAEGQLGSYGASDGEKVPKKVKIEHDLSNVISYSESTTLSTSPPQNRLLYYL